jgi:hypothetical protein
VPFRLWSIVYTGNTTERLGEDCATATGVVIGFGILGSIALFAVSALGIAAVTPPGYSCMPLGTSRFAAVGADLPVALGLVTAYVAAPFLALTGYLWYKVHGL